uniref:U5 small nuclear ribonucleoprotein TSSC4 n=1 Tax=Anopheles culicifacies TaxID=139723 RepID=A0A182MU83_9DIPT
MSFEEKKNLLFSSLQTAEQSIAADSILHQENVKEADYSLVHMSKCRIKPIRVDRYQGRESIFKRPNAPIRQCLKRSTSHLPDYKRNPNKWIKYSLEDVDTSDRSNMAAAFSFLRQMEEQREAAENEQDDGNRQDSSTQPCKSIVRFNRSVRLRGQLDEADEPVETPVEDRPQFNGRRVLMPEYVVGQKDPKRAKRSKPRKPANAGKGTALQLDHLMEEEEEIDPDEEGAME